MILSPLHLLALSEVDGPLRTALERAFIAKVPLSAITWDLDPARPSGLRDNALPACHRLHVRGWEVWNAAAGWTEDSEAILKSAAGKP